MSLKIKIVCSADLGVLKTGCICSSTANSVREFGTTSRLIGVVVRTCFRPLLWLSEILLNPSLWRWWLWRVGTFGYKGMRGFSRWKDLLLQGGRPFLYMICLSLVIGLNVNIKVPCQRGQKDQLSSSQWVFSAQGKLFLFPPLLYILCTVSLVVLSNKILWGFCLTVLRLKKQYIETSNIHFN